MTRLTEDYQSSKTILYYTVMYYIMMDTCHYAYVKTSSMSPNKQPLSPSHVMEVIKHWRET